MQKYNKTFLRCCYHISREMYFDLGNVIFDSLVDCKNNLLRPKKKLATELWLGHLISHLLVKSEFPIERHELTESHLVPFTWDSWSTLFAARDLARRARTVPSVTEESVETPTEETPLPARTSSSRPPR